jgi:hypothetical protein
MNQIDPKLKDLLVREAHLRLSRARLTPVWSNKEAELRAIQAAKPTFFPVFSTRKRAAYEQRLADTQQAVDILRQGMAVLDRLEAQVKNLIAEEIENILRANHPEYVEALTALRQKRLGDHQASVIDERKTGEVRSALFGVWERFRSQVAPEIYPGDTERVVEDTEALLPVNAGGLTLISA